MIIPQQECVTETLIHQINVLQLIGNLPRVIQNEATLNNKYTSGRVIPTKLLDEVKKSHSIMYYGIGKKGYYMDNGYKYPYRPDSKEMDLYSPLPFKCVPLGQSLNEYEKDIYRLPVPMILKDGNEYICYFLKKIKIFKTEPDIINVSENGLETLVDLSYDGIYPIPNESNISHNIEYNTAHRSVKIEFNHLTITSTEQEEIRKYFFDNEDVIISEMGLYSGYEDSVERIAYNVQLAFKLCNTGVLLTKEKNYARNIKLTYGNKLLI